MIVKDAMVIIHLAKMSLLETACDYFGKVFVPPLVSKEVLNDKYDETSIIALLLENGKIKVKEVANKKLIQKANEFNVQRGEAEAVALYLEINADYLATDDDNVRKKKDMLKIAVIGTPAIILTLYKKKKISKEKLFESMKILKNVGWFSNTIWDKIMMEVKNG